MTVKDTLEDIRTVIGDPKCHVCHGYTCLNIDSKENNERCCICVRKINDAWSALTACDECHFTIFENLMKRKLKQWESWD